MSETGRTLRGREDSELQAAITGTLLRRC